MPLDLGKSNYIFGSWKPFEVDIYDSYQMGFKVSFFASSKELGNAYHVVLDENDIEPWYETSSISQQSSSSLSIMPPTAA